MLGFSSLGEFPVGGLPGITGGIASQSGIATGINGSPIFGTPYGVYSKVCQATGIAASVAFGTPLVPPPTVGAATSIDSTVAFGTPTVPPPVVGITSGVNSSVFGLPLGSTANKYIATPIADSVFGAPYGIYDIVERTYGITGALMGRPVWQITNFAPSVGTGTVFGSPKAEVRHKTCSASAVSSTLSFGNPASVSVVLATVASIGGATFGLPKSIYPQKGIHSGINETQFGVPRFPMDSLNQAVFFYSKTNRIMVVQ